MSQANSSTKPAMGSATGNSSSGLNAICATLAPARAVAAIYYPPVQTVETCLGLGDLCLRNARGASPGGHAVDLASAGNDSSQWGMR